MATVQEGEKCNIPRSTKRPVYQCSIGANSQHREQGLWSQLAKVLLPATAQIAAKINFTTALTSMSEHKGITKVKAELICRNLQFRWHGG